MSTNMDLIKPRGNLSDLQDDVGFLFCFHHTLGHRLICVEGPSRHCFGFLSHMSHHMYVP